MVELINFKDTLIEDLKDPAYARTYLSVALEEYEKDQDGFAFLTALRDVAEARGGIGKLAKKTNLNRENLYKVLSSKGNPRLKVEGKRDDGKLSLMIQGKGLRDLIEMSDRAQRNHLTGIGFHINLGKIGGILGHFRIRLQNHMKLTAGLIHRRYLMLSKGVIECLIHLNRLNTKTAGKIAIDNNLDLPSLKL